MLRFFHWACLNNLASRLPLHTLQLDTIFPPSNLASPIADVLREQLSSVNWARAGLGLPLIEEPIGVLEETTAHDVTDYTDWSTFDAQEKVTFPANLTTPASVPPNSVSRLQHRKTLELLIKWDSNVQEHAVINFTTATTTCDTITIHSAASPRKLYDTRTLVTALSHRSTLMTTSTDDDQR
ncbi:hypothetical protein INR49_015735 [Caranx melampygus]|nr:hypothetical protein INR49_015735 [Caranx melampygus]